MKEEGQLMERGDIIVKEKIRMQRSVSILSEETIEEHTTTKHT